MMLHVSHWCSVTLANEKETRVDDRDVKENDFNYRCFGRLNEVVMTNEETFLI